MINLVYYISIYAILARHINVELGNSVSYISFFKKKKNENLDLLPYHTILTFNDPVSEAF